MSFFGVIRPGYAKQDQRFFDQCEFGRRWEEVRDDEEAHCWVVINHTVFGWPKAKDAKRGRTTSVCRHCRREFTDAIETTGHGIFCQGCDAALMPKQPEVNHSAKWCPALMGGYHSYPKGAVRCQHCLKTKEQAGLVPSQPALVRAR